MKVSTRSYRLAGVAAALGPAIALAQVSSAPTYTLSSLPGTGALEARAYAINAVGQTVGVTQTGNEDAPNHSALWFNGITTDLEGVVHFELLHPYFGISIHEAYGISNGGQIVGTHQLEIDCPPTIRMTMAYVLQPAVLSDLGSPYAGDAVIRLGTFGPFCVAHDSAATDVSNANHVVGWADVNTRAGVTHAFVVVPANGTWGVDVLPPPVDPSDPPGEGVNDLMIDLHTLDAFSAVSAATAVNDYGVVTGYSYTITNTLNGQAAYHAFRIVPQGGVWYVDAGNGPCGPCGSNGQDSLSPCGQCGSNALMQSIGTLGGLNSWGRGINNAGVIVGESETSDRHVRAFKWENGVMTDLGTLGGDNSSAAGINELGQIVGWAEDNRGSRRACVWINGQINDLNTRLLATQGGGTQLQEARDINDHGQIVGWARGTNGTEIIETAFGLRIASQAEIDEANAIVAGTQDSSDPDSPDGGSTGGGSTGGTGTGVQVDGTPQSLDGSEGGDEGAVDGGAAAGPAGLCGAGLANMLPFMLAGLVALSYARRR